LGGQADEIQRCLATGGNPPTKFASQSTSHLVHIRGQLFFQQITVAWVVINAPNHAANGGFFCQPKQGCIDRFTVSYTGKIDLGKGPTPTVSIYDCNYFFSILCVILCKPFL
jgi:hypothetical protein